MMNTQRLTVSEPWDFKSSHGDNFVRGKVVRLIDPENLIFESEEPISVAGKTGRVLILSTRYENESFEQEPYSNTVNGGILQDGDYQDGSAKSLKEKASFVLIGSLGA